MNQSSPEYPNHHTDREPSVSSFVEKMSELLPDIQWRESHELLDARITIINALQTPDIDPTLLTSAWSEYAIIHEQSVDQESSNLDSVLTRAQLQIATLVHKALIFREVDNIQRYGEELVDAEEYAYQEHLDDVSRAINDELDTLR